MKTAEENPDANSTRIAGRKTCEQWREFIDKEKDEVFWQTAYNDYFYKRLETRYLNPIKAIENSFFSTTEESKTEESKKEGNGEGNGEGFSIMAILCTLVEFLEATRQGKEYRQLIRENYTYAQQGRLDLINPPFDPNNQYYKSKEYFINFLRNQKPFDVFFPNDKSAENFYEFIRCGLLHEAQTKEGWKIKIAGKKSSNKALIDAEKRIVYRDNFREAFDTYLKIYEEELKTDVNLQNALIKKFNSLCKE